jgi:hypothetical protein
VKFTRKGRELTAREMNNPALREALEGTARMIEAKTKALRCPVHKRGLENQRLDFEGSDVSFLYDVCCDELKRLAGRALA